MKRNILVLGIIFIAACNQTKDSNQQQTTSNRQAATDNKQQATNNQQSSAIVSDRSITGEWYQQYAVLDQNGDAILDPAERNGTKSTMGFNYFQFNDDGKALYDSDAKFKATYEVKDENGKKTLFVTVNGFGETYKYTIIEPVADELILYSFGVYMIYKKK